MNYKVQLFGSFVNGLNTSDGSDLDLTILVGDFGGKPIKQRNLLRNVCNVLYGVKMPKNNNHTPRYDIDYPRCDNSGWILQVKDLKYGIDIDIMVNKTAEIENSLLIMEYVKLEPRLLKVIHFLKSKNKEFCPDKQYRLNSFSLYLMVIAFFQRIGLLPNLQALNHVNPSFSAQQI
jgi:DNA polymerase sigma